MRQALNLPPVTPQPRNIYQPKKMGREGKDWIAEKMVGAHERCTAVAYVNVRECDQTIHRHTTLIDPDLGRSMRRPDGWVISAKEAQRLFSDPLCE